MEKRVILVTGASSGIGKQTALALAKQGYQLIIHGRDEKRTKEVYDEIRNIPENGGVDMYLADFSLMSGVKKFADQIIGKYDRIDVLLNNAGGQFGNDRQETAEGHEKMFAINTLAPFLLTNLLLPLLRKSNSARIITVSSESYRQAGNPILDDIELKKNYTMFRAYGYSKLYVFWIMREFDERLKNKGINNVTVNVCEPGSAVTRLARESLKMWWYKIVAVLWLPMMRSAKTGAQTSIYLASSDEVEGISGKFFGKCKVKNIDPKWISQDGQKIIWDYCENVCKPYMKESEDL